MKGPQGQPIPLHYTLRGESLDYLSDVLYQRRLLGKMRGVRKQPDNTHIVASQYFGQLAPHSGMLPHGCDSQAQPGKKAAAVYRK